MGLHPQSFSCVQLFVIPWTVAHLAPLSMEFSRQEYWSGLSFSIPVYLPDPWIKPMSLRSPALAGEFFTTEKSRKPYHGVECMLSFCSHLCNPMDYSLPGFSVHRISRQEYWSRFPCPPPGDLPNPGTEPVSLRSSALAGRFFTTSTTILINPS